MKYFKILNKQECHHGLQYKTGLNIDPVPFEEKGSCVPGGIYFASKDIFAFSHYGVWVREVKIPKDAKMVKDPEEGPEKFRADRVILGRKRKLWKEATIKWMIKNGADIHADDDWALISSAWGGNIEAVKLLLDNGANIHARKDEALRKAAFEDHFEVVKLLVEHGADIHAIKDEALRDAALLGNFEIVKLLIENGADIHAEEDEAFIKAAFHGNIVIAKLLVENGADIHAKGDLALIVAKRNGDKRVVKYLERKG